MEKIYKAAIYLRLSRDDEHTGESCSISNQRQLLENFVDGKNDIEIVKEYVDDGFSGYDFDRPGFCSMIADINECVIDCVIVKDLSRLGRNFQRTEEYIQRFFPNKNVRFIAVSDCFDSAKETSITDLLAFPVKNLINEYHVMETSLKIRNVFEHYRQTGKLFIGNTPFGYVIKDKKIVVDDEAATIVRLIFDMKINGSSNQGIADILNENGVKSPLEYRISKGYGDTGSHFKKDENAVWQSMSVKRILENPIYIGTLIQGKTTSASYKDRRRHDRDQSDLIVFEHSHEAIVSETVFYIVQDLLSKDSYTKGAEKKSYLFSGFAYCARCGNVVYHESAYKGKTIWRCRNKECTCKARINEDKLKDCVFKALKLHVDAAMESFKSPNLIHSDKKLVDNDKVIELQAQIEKTQFAKDKLNTHLESGMISKSDHDELFSFYDIKIEKLRSEIEKARSNKAKLINNMGEIKLMYDDLVDMKELTRGMIATFIEKIEIVNKNKIRIYFRFKDIFEEVNADGKKVTQK